jgi:hypothetical protein
MRLPTRRPPTPPVVQLVEPHRDQLERRARAFARVWPLLATSIPVEDIVEAYFDELDRP